MYPFTVNVLLGCALLISGYNIVFGRPSTTRQQVHDYHPQPFIFGNRFVGFIASTRRGTVRA